MAFARPAPIDFAGEANVSHIHGESMLATNRQKKLLRFFGISYSRNISTGAAGWEIAGIMESEENRARWHKYLFVTGDFDSESDELIPCDEHELESVVVPDEWSAAKAIGQFRDEIVVAELADGSPYDSPQPKLEFCEHRFMFTGNFSYGSQKACQAAVLEKGGLAPSSKYVSRDIDYLVIGSGGSKFWKRGSYGNKIEKAILARREHGSPAIISEEHWLGYIANG